MVEAPFGLEGQLEVADDLVDGFWSFDKRDDPLERMLIFVCPS